MVGLVFVGVQHFFIVNILYQYVFCGVVFYFTSIEKCTGIHSCIFFLRINADPSIHSSFFWAGGGRLTIFSSEPFGCCM